MATRVRRPYLSHDGRRLVRRGPEFTYESDWDTGTPLLG